MQPRAVGLALVCQQAEGMSVPQQISSDTLSAPHKGESHLGEQKTKMQLDKLLKRHIGQQ
jgi:hypothetical protein